MEKVYFLIIILIISIACSNGVESKKITKDINLKSSLIKPSNDSIPKIINFSFPETVLINEESGGVLKYDLKLDSIDKSKLIERHIYLYVAPIAIFGGVKEVEKNDHRILVDTIGDGSFYFYVRFNKLGANRVTLIVQDNLILKGENQDEKIVVITEETSLIRDVYVKEK